MQPKVSSCRTALTPAIHTGPADAQTGQPGTWGMKMTVQGKVTLQALPFSPTVLKISHKTGP